MSDKSNGSDHDNQHHTDSDGSEDLDNHQTHSPESDNQDDEIEEIKQDLNDSQTSSLRDAHGDVALTGKKAKDGYAEVNNTQKDEDDNSAYTSDMGKAATTTIQPTFNIHNMTPEMRQQLILQMQQMQNINPQEVVNVVQCCLDGSFKPFLA